MRICIPTKTEEGINSLVSDHFGSAPYFTIYDSITKAFEIIDNVNQHHIHGACNPVGILNEKNVDIVICGGMGVRALQKLLNGNIKAYRAFAGTVEEIIKNYHDGHLVEMNLEYACNQHKCK